MYLNEPLVTIIRERLDEPKFNYALPEPTTYSATTSTMVDSGTSVSGKLLGSIVRPAVRQISVSWNFLNAEDWSEINDLFAKNYTNDVKFFDQASADWIESKMYISDRSAGMWRRDDEGNVLGWTGCSLQFTEV